MTTPQSATTDLWRSQPPAKDPPTLQPGTIVPYCALVLPLL